MKIENHVGKLMDICTYSVYHFQCYFEWDLLVISESYWLIQILLRENFKIIFLYAQNDNEMNEKLNINYIQFNKTLLTA